MGMVMLGMFALNPVGLTGSIIQQLNHGISTGALFLLVGVMYERRHTREISEYGGLSKVMPVYATIFMIMTMSSIGLPTLNGFIGEFLILQGAFIANIWWAVVAGSGVVLGAAYMLWLYQRTMFGKVENPKNEKLLDMNLREIATFVPLIILAVWIGIYPSPFLRILSPTVNTVIARLNPAYPAVAAAAAAKQKDCDENKALTAFTTPPCGDAAAPPPAGAVAAQPGAGSVPVATPAAADGAPRPRATETSPAGGRH
jgi:NADH-quinone oxidoreductase subunit M